MGVNRTGHRTGRTAKDAAAMGHVVGVEREAELQRRILQLLRSHPRVVWCSRMNAGRVRGVQLGTTGIPDLIGQLVDGRFLGIEVKRKGGKLRESQAEFIERATRHHAAVGVAYDVDDAMAIIAM